MVPVQTPSVTAAPAAPTAVQPAAPTSSAPAVSDAAWTAVTGRYVEVDTATGSVLGELATADGNTIVLVQSDGEVVSFPKAQATAVRVVPGPSAAAPIAAPSGATPAESMAALGPAPTSTTDPAATAEGEPAEEEEELTPGQQRRKERREKREHALLGAFSMHGATYSHWRGDGINAGHASYAMDWGLGANLSPKFGMYAMAGGLFGAKIEDGDTKANYGHIAALFTFGGKHYFTTAGAGVAFSRLRYRDTTLDRDRGLALPMKLVGKIPLPHKLYIGIGLTYELAMVRGFSRFVNAIGGQIVIGRW